MISVIYHDDLKEVQGDAALAALLSAPAAAAPFDRIAWWHNLADSLGFVPLIAVAREGEAGVALPLRRVGRRIEALAGWYTFRVVPLFFGPIDFRRNQDVQLLTQLARDLASQAPRLTLAPLPDDEYDRSAHKLTLALRRAGWLVFVEQCDVNHVLKLAGRSYAEYLAARPGPLRTTLKRKAGKVSVTIETHFNPDSWAAYEAIYTDSWKPEEGSPAFLRRFAEEEGAAGRLRLGVARADGVPVAAQLWTVEHATAFIHKLAHTETAKPLSPGTTLSAALFEHVIDRDGVAMVDFGTGDDPYKRDWMEMVRPRYRIEAFRLGWPGNWPAIARLLADDIKRRLVRRRVAG